MSIEDEIHVYAHTKVSRLTGETESYDASFFTNVIRKKELELIEQLIMTDQPTFILDYGCGGGWFSWLYAPRGNIRTKSQIKGPQTAWIAKFDRFPTPAENTFLQGIQNSFTEVLL